MNAAAGGPAGAGATTATQSVVLQKNTNNPGGNTFVVATNPVTVSFAFGSQTYAAVPVTTMSTGTGLAFGARNAPSTLQNGTANIYSALSTFGGTANASYTSLNNVAAGSGIDGTANGGIELSANVNVLETAGVPTSSRQLMGSLVISFSVPVNNPVIHFSGLGGTSDKGLSATVLGITTEFDLDAAASPGLSLTKLSGNSAFSVTSTQIVNAASPLGGTCSPATAACGSVVVNGTAITSVTLKVFMRGDGTKPNWVSTFPIENAGDAFLIGVSVPPVTTVTVNEVSLGGVGTFGFTGTNGLAAQNLLTAISGTAVAGPKQYLTQSGTSTVITQATMPANFTLTSVSCPGLLPADFAVNLAAGTVTLNANATVADSNVSCTFTNTFVPLVNTGGMSGVPGLSRVALLALGILLYLVGYLSIARKAD